MKMPNILKHKVLTVLLAFCFCLASVIGSSYAVTVTRVELAQNTITAVTTTDQEAEAGTAVDTPPQVKVEDAFGNPVVGVNIDFAVASGGGSIIGSSTITTDSNGLAAVGGWTLGSTPGDNTLTASNDHYAGSPVIFSATALADAETPTFSPAAGAVAHDATVTISSATGGATIYYTTDGSEPTTSSSVYSAALPVTAAMTVKAIAVATGYGDSAVGSAAYTLSETAATPTFSPDAGAVTSGTSVTISSTTSGATLYYTTDGSEPTISSTEYSAAVAVTPPMTLKAIAVADGYNNSAVGSAAYTLTAAATPTFSPAAGAVAHDATVTISSATGGATIYYTTDGSEPTTSSSVYSAALPVTAAMTVKAIAVATGYGDSAVGSAAYTLSETAATPTFSPVAGAVALGTTVTISSTTAGAIYYTTNGSDPTTSSTLYTGPVTISSAMTLKAIAVATGYNNSAVGSASYTQAATANLTGLVLSGSPSNYSFSGGTYTYNGITVANAVSSITVTPTGAGTITVNGTTVASGSASAAINLTAEVEKTITVVVTETGKTSKTYTLKVTRVADLAPTVTWHQAATSFLFFGLNFPSTTTILSIDFSKIIFKANFTNYLSQTADDYSMFDGFYCRLYPFDGGENYGLSWTTGDRVTVRAGAITFQGGISFPDADTTYTYPTSP